MTDHSAIADAYLAVWNEPDADKRRSMIETGWTSDASYVDPMMKGHGHDGIALMIEAARAQFPSHHFRLRGQPDGHGSLVRFSWSLSPTGGAPIADGTDVVRLAHDGRIADVTGFLDAAPAN